MSPRVQSSDNFGVLVDKAVPPILNPPGNRWSPQMTQTIYYYAHDVTRASGGVAALYEHVAVLRRHGFDAYILHSHPGFVPDWLSVDAPIRYAQGDFRPEPNDFVVIPEDFSSAVQRFATIPCRRLIFCQNQFYAATALVSIGDWRKFGVEGVMASSVTVRDFLFLAGWPDAPLVPYAIDAERFRPRQKTLQVAYMPRKRSLDATTIRFLFPRRFPEYADVPWVALDGMHRDRIAEELSQTAIFLALGQNESMGLPALEAMAAGALVAGFHGDGDLGLPDARHSALWVDRVDDALAALASLVQWVRDDDARANQQREAASGFVQNYSPEGRDAALLQAWNINRQVTVVTT